MPCAWPVTEDMKNPEHWPVAIGQANFAGEIVAVVADSRYAAADAVEAVVVDYDLLPAVVGLEDARSDRVVHESLGTNTSYVWELIPDPDAIERSPTRPTSSVSATSSSASSRRRWSHGASPSCLRRREARSPCTPRPRSPTS